MAPSLLCSLFGLVVLTAAIATQAYQSPPLETSSIASKSSFSPARLNTMTSIRGAAMSSSERSPLSMSTSIRNLTVSTLAAKNISGSVDFTSVSTTLTQNLGNNSAILRSGLGHFGTTTPNWTTSALVTNVSSSEVGYTSIPISNLQNKMAGTSSAFLQDGSRSYESATSNSTTAKMETKAISSGSPATSVSSILNILTSPPSSVAGFNGTASMELSPANISRSTNQTSISSAPASSTGFTATTTHSNDASLGFQASTSAWHSSTSSLTRNSIASTTIFPASTSSGTRTSVANVQINIPTTSLSPLDAAAIAGGIAIGEGLLFLYSKARSISDEAELLASKTQLISSMETLKSDLESLSIDLGGDGGSISCGGSKSRSRYRKTSILGNLLSTITRTVCSLTKLEAEIDAVAPDLDDIEAGWTEIEGLVGDLTEEEEEEEEEEEKKESQSLEEKRASETAKPKSQESTSTLEPSSTRSSSTSANRVSSTSISSDIAPCFSGLIQGYPVDDDDSEAADDAVLSMIGAVLFSIMGGNSTSSGSSNSTTTLIAKTTTRADADLSSRIMSGSWLNGVWTSGGGSKNGITTSAAKNITSTAELLTTFTSPLLSGGSNSASPSIVSTVKNDEPGHGSSAQISTSESKIFSTTITQPSVSAASGGSTSGASLVETFARSHSLLSPTTTNKAIVATTTAPIVEFSVPAATPSRAMIIYRRDFCDPSRVTTCSSWALEYDITPGQSLDTCPGRANYQAPNYKQRYPQYENGVTSNYPINIGPFVSHGFRDCSYIGTSQEVGDLKCPLIEAPCSVPTATAERCGLATDTPIVYAEW